MNDQGGDELRPHDLTDDEVQIAGTQEAAIESLRQEGHVRDDTLADIQAAAKDIASRAAAIQVTTGQGVIADNITFRRRNRVLMIGMAILLFSSGLTQFRYYFQVRPQSNDIEANTADLKNANDKLDRLEAFVASVEADQNEPDVIDPTQLQAVFDAVLETRALICSIDDPVRAAACRDIEETP